LQPDQTEDLLPRLAPATQALLFKGLQHVLRIQLEAQEAAAGLEERRRKALAEAVSLGFEHRAERYRLAIIEDYLVLRCPRCLRAFLDYEACDALRCGNCGCGFCALCLQGQCF
jgi:hypothetical protein